MRTFDLTMLSAMNLKELAQIQTQVQAEIDSKNQQVSELRNTIFVFLKKIEEVSGDTNVVDEVINQYKNESADQAEETPCQEDNLTKESHSPQELLPSLEDLCAMEHDAMDSLINNTPSVTPTDESLEYQSEEEYNLMHTRAKMIQPLDSMITGDLYPGIFGLGYTKVLGKDDYKQHLRAISAYGAGGNTLTCQVSPWIYIPEKTASAA